MRNHLMLVSSLALTAALASPALAGGSGGTLGVGAEYTLAGIGGPSINYDAGMFHAGGFVGYYDAGFRDPELDALDLGGRFFYHLHSTAMSDFSLGAGLGLQFQDYVDPDVDSATVLEIDVGAQIRAFIVSNVAVSGTIGLAILTADADGLGLTGDALGSVGIHYYFF